MTTTNRPRRGAAKGRATTKAKRSSRTGSKAASASSRSTARPQKRETSTKSATKVRKRVAGPSSNPARKTTVKKKAAARKSTARKSTARKSTASKSTARKSTASKSTARKSTASKSAARKPASRNATSRTTVTRTSTTARGPATPRKNPTRPQGPTKARRRTPASPVGSRRRSSSHRRRSDGAFGLIRGIRGGKRKGRSVKLAPVTDAGERNAAYLTATVVGLTLFGLVMVLSASSVSSLEYADSPFSRFKMQAAFAAVGMVGFIIMSRVDYRRLRPLVTPLLVLTTGLLVLLLIPKVGTTRNGSSRWLDLGPIAVQPSELAKPVMILFVADLLARRERRMDRADLTVRPIMIVLGILSTLMVLQPKLGTPIIISAVTILMLFVAGAKLKSLGGWMAFAVAAATILAIVTPYRRARLTSFLNPWDSPQGIGFQAFQSQVGVASGGFLGTGLGASRSKWGYLPEVDTDFIFAVVAEEVGLVGASALIGGYVLVAWFGFKAAIGAPDRFGALLATGITSWLLIQAFLNIGMVLGVLPITGEPLPLISRGGSSLMTTLAAAGLLTSVSRRSKG